MARFVAACTLTIAVVSACGGSTSTRSAATPTPPPAATASAPPAGNATPSASLHLPVATATLVSTPTDGIVSALPTPTDGIFSTLPTPSVAGITFARDSLVTSTAVTLIDEQARFQSGRAIAWRLELPAALGLEIVRVTVVNEGTGSMSLDESFTPEPGSSIYYGNTVLASDVGGYVMRYYVNGVVFGEGRFSIRAAADVATPNPTPDRTPKPTRRPTDPPSGNCDPSYPTVCIPPGPPDLDCGEIRFQNFEVRGRDYHGFDGDNDGIGCES